MMLPARALAYAIIVSVFVAILSLALIQFSELSRFLRTEQMEQDRLLRNLSSGVNIVMGNSQDIEPKTIDLFDNQKDSIHIAKHKWGFFNIGLVSAFVNNQVIQDTIQKIFLMGAEKSKILDFALYFPFSNYSLTVSGNTLIVGDVALPKEGIKSGSIAGVSYTRSKSFYGQQFLPNTPLPSVNKDFLSSILNLYNTPSPISKSIPKSITRSFAETTLFIKGDSLSLDNCIIMGNIIVKSKKAITIGANCQITDAILIAPKIYFKSRFQGSLQAFA